MRPALWLVALGMILSSVTILGLSERLISAALPRTCDATCIETQALAAEQSAANATWVSALVGLGAVVVSTLGLFALFTSLGQTRVAISNTREIGEVQTQAYVHAARAEFGIGNNVLIYCQNTGQTPASHFSITGTVRRAKRGKISASVRFRPGPFKTWSSLGAGATLSVSLDVDPKVIADFRGERFDADEVLLVCGQIIYCTIFNHDHETQFAFYVDHLAPERFRRPTANIRSYWRIRNQYYIQTGMEEQT